MSSNTVKIFNGVIDFKNILLGILAFIISQTTPVSWHKSMIKWEIMNDVTVSPKLGANFPPEVAGVGGKKST